MTSNTTSTGAPAYNPEAPLHNPAEGLKWLGYNEARDGKPYPDAYDGWTMDEQRVYELGRALQSVLAAFGPTPEWRVEVALTAAIFPQLRDRAIQVAFIRSMVIGYYTGDEAEAIVAWKQANPEYHILKEPSSDDEIRPVQRAVSPGMEPLHHRKIRRHSPRQYQRSQYIPNIPVKVEDPTSRGVAGQNRTPRGLSPKAPARR